MKHKNIEDSELKELLDYIEYGDPIKDRWDEGDLFWKLAEDLARARNIDYDPRDRTRP